MYAYALSRVWINDSVGQSVSNRGRRVLPVQLLKINCWILLKLTELNKVEDRLRAQITEQQNKRWGQIERQSHKNILVQYTGLYSRKRDKTCLCFKLVLAWCKTSDEIKASLLYYCSTTPDWWINTGGRIILRPHKGHDGCQNKICIAANIFAGLNILSRKHQHS